jgi:hypothetical protein
MKITAKAARLIRRRTSPSAGVLALEPRGEEYGLVHDLEPFHLCAGHLLG